MAADSGLAPSLVASSERSQREGPGCLTPRQILRVDIRFFGWKSEEMDIDMRKEKGGLIAVFLRITMIL